MYTATESLVNGAIKCVAQGTYQLVCVCYNC